MPLHNLADPDLSLPSQLVFDTSFLLALRPVGDNPHTALAQAFARRLRPHIAAIKLAAWLVMPVLQECYHIILASSLRRAWQELAGAARPPNWLALYKQNPMTIGLGFADIEQFDALLAAYPITVAHPHDLVRGLENSSLDIRLRRFIRQYQLLPQDALILAEAERLGVTAVRHLRQRLAPRRA